MTTGICFNGVVHCSDDSYSQWTYPCPGCDRCRPKKEEDVAHTGTSEVMKPLGSLPGGGKAVLRVSIPVKVGGYTGQRDQWTEHEQDYNVSLDGDKVVLHNTGHDGRKITFDRAGLDAALNVLENYQR